jgi:hypothetical protein
MSAGIEGLAANAWAVSPLAMMLKYGGPEMKAPTHLRAINNALVDAIAGRGPRNIAIAAPPRAAKTTLLSVWLPLWILALDPTKKCISLAYGDQLAWAQGRLCRNYIEEFSEELGFRVASDSRSVERFAIEQHGGGLLSAGILSAITGFGASGCLVIDDPVKGPQDATPDNLERIWEMYQAVARTRLEGLPLQIVSHTRWDRNDLIGRLKASPSAHEWLFLDFAALHEENFPDPLTGRVKGESLWPERWTPEQLQSTKVAVGPGVWSALYQQNPTDSSTAGRAYYEFSAQQHVRDVRFNPELPLCLSFDFNRSPATCLFGQMSERFTASSFLTNEKIFSVSILSELVIDDCPTTDLLAAIHERLLEFRARGRKLQVHVYGDASGRQLKSAAADSDWDQVREFFSRHSDAYYVNYFIEKQNPGVKDSVEQVNALLRAGELTIAPSCKQLITDLRENTWRKDSDGNVVWQISKSDPRRTHAGDACRYLVYGARPRQQWGEMSESLI